MRWELSAEQADLRTVLRAWLREHCTTADVRTWADARDAGPFERRFAADGWAGVGTPEELGGQGGGLVEQAIVAEELGRAVAPSALWTGSVLAAPALAGAPDAAAGLFAGEPVVLAVPSDAVPGPRHARGPGPVRSVLGGDRGARLLVPGRDGAFLLVGPDDADVVARALTDGTRSVADVGAPRAAVDVPGDVDAVLGAVALRAAVLVSADALGAAERMLEMSVAYALERRQFGVPIGSFQAVQHAAAQMLVQVESARSIVYLAAASVGSGHPDAGMHAAAAKAQVTAGAAVLADTALTLHGAIGYTWEHDLQLSYKRAKLDRVLFGAPKAWNERIAAALELVPAPV
ncbi:acyl-CoA dehydrogenase [Pseudonocardia broussonetiae]|uniref:Acyl-CoA dehydrogenase n=1 Tax=Pseudonocardia broussonetiae TaxID=2736640 RepID=A0A6M6JJD7_9PSEU|nr:acyl-CoA dehydrogenase [Pseudonocardia broussonetiae]QJY48244.1 acyl-CoA dehydrogenase [Pseudonocardia broussonetiae]